MDNKEGWNWGREMDRAGVAGRGGRKRRKTYLNNNKKIKLKNKVVDKKIKE